MLASVEAGDGLVSMKLRWCGQDHCVDIIPRKALCQVFGCMPDPSFTRETLDIIGATTHDRSHGHTVDP